MWEAGSALHRTPTLRGREEEVERPGNLELGKAGEARQSEVKTNQTPQEGRVR